MNVADDAYEFMENSFKLMYQNCPSFNEIPKFLPDNIECYKVKKDYETKNIKPAAENVVFDGFDWDKNMKDAYN